MNDNIMVPLSEVAKIDISGVDKKTKENEIPVSLCNFTDVYYNWSITKNMVPGFMKATANKKEIDRFSLIKGQVVITKDSETRDDIGMSAYIADDLPETILGYHCAVITPDEKALDGRYLNAYLSSRYGRKYFEYKAGGSGQRYTLTVEGISNIKIPLIPLSEQKKIGKFLSNLDKKIENNNAISSQLESLAKTIYDYWFLQFDFPDENGNPYRSSGGKMVWNNELKREIPEGWKAVQIADILGQYPRTQTVNRDDYKKGEKYPIIDQSKDFICGYSDDSNKALHMKDCIVYGDHTTFLKYINFDFCRGADGTQVINSKEANLSNILLYYELKELPIIEIGYKRHFKFLKSQCIIVPSKQINDLFRNASKTLFDKKKNILKENRQLTSLRDFLLPLLMNGQVTLK